MKHILARIDVRARAVERHPFLVWLDDESIPPVDRLGAWLPEAAFFVFGFRDLNAVVLKYDEAEAAACPRRRAINRHLVEDATHWPWYLKDLQVLGLDRDVTLSGALRFLWGRDTAAQRHAVYRLCALAGKADDPVLRYALIAALEAVAHRLFARVLPVAKAHEAATGTRLLYLGPHHFEREPGHLTHQDDDAGDDVFADLVLADAERDDAWCIADEVMSLVEARWTEFHRIAVAKTAPALVAA